MRTPYILMRDRVIGKRLKYYDRAAKRMRKSLQGSIELRRIVCVPLLPALDELECGRAGIGSEIPALRGAVLRAT
jgi:hypothetical protein